MRGAAQRSSDPRIAAVLILAAGAATIAGALVFEHVWGLRPCKLCLIQRYPYYAAFPVALAVAAAPGATLGRLGLAILALLFLVSAALGAYHAGVEWGVFTGPNDCGGSVSSSPGNVADFMATLQSSRVVSCTEAAWRFLGLSLAGWNVLISLALAALAGTAMRRSRALEVAHAH